MFWRHAAALACVLALFSLEIRGETGAEQQWEGGGAEEDVGACGETYERYWACIDKHENMHPSDALSACAATFAAVEACKSAPENSQDLPPKNDERGRAQEERVETGELRMALLQPKHWEVFDVDGEVRIYTLAVEEFSKVDLRGLVEDRSSGGEIWPWGGGIVLVVPLPSTFGTIPGARQPVPKCSHETPSASINNRKGRVPNHQVPL